MHLVLLYTTPNAKHKINALVNRCAPHVSITTTHLLSTHHQFPPPTPHNSTILALDHQFPTQQILISLTKAHFKTPLLLIAAPLPLVHDALQQGANGCFTDWPTPDEFLAALTLINNGHTFLDRDASFLMHTWTSSSTTPPILLLLNRLSERERQVLVALGHGASNQEIATMFDITINTVRSHIKNLYRKLGVRHRSDLVRVALMYTQN